METYLTFDDSTQKQELLRCWSEISFLLTTVQSGTHSRPHSSYYQRFRQIRTPFPTDDQSEENRGDLSAKARSRLHSSNHHHRQQPSERRWQVDLLRQHDITERTDWWWDLGTDWQSERIFRQTHQAPMEWTRSATSYQNQCVLCCCTANTVVWVWSMDTIPPTHTKTRPIPDALPKVHR